MRTFSFTLKDIELRIEADSERAAQLIAVGVEAQMEWFLVEALLAEDQHAGQAEYDRLHGKLRETAVSHLRDWIAIEFPDYVIEVELLSLN